ncbi:TusE/DsrC/DsvC family sulfur relay protein [Moraxella sp. ZY210820]|uniref:TusE/DsrC/DsvC family sulfur relay protein n=1 Tax=unclassified Moraxella TaxID=2685852 RepID=UPI00273083EB|nr:TusE/DsrC/DsvC family sulfur relay protein [Moraxella sp. ZY210820]WLF83031.1 TusE/DsrC/DsvC family sulfur relay protein [Moraxella sp. ZY210820]
MSLILDDDGHLLDHTQWNEQIAQQLADNLDIQLDDWHIQVLLGVRQFYQQFGYAPATRPLIKFLAKHISADIDNAMLQQRFNTGLVARHLCRVAGVPKPANCL